MLQSIIGKGDGMMRVRRWFGIAALVLSPALAVAGGVAAVSTSAEAGQSILLAQSGGQSGGGETKPQEPAAAADAGGQPAAGGETAEAEGPAEFTEAFLQDPEQLSVGKELWDSTCQHCHGSKAYPGKAPKLKTANYTPEFVFDRVTHGFRKMPAWKDVFTKEERMAISAYVLSDKFSP